MNLKKFLLFAFVAIAVALSAHGADLSREALNLRAQIKSYLTQTGHNPTIDQDGDVRFTYEGHVFYIQIFDIAGDIAFDYDNSSYYVHFQDYKDAVAVSLFKSYRNDTGKSNAALDRICYDVMSDFVMVKVYPSSTYKTIRVETEALYTTSAQVKEFFEDNLMVVSIVAEDLLERF